MKTTLSENLEMDRNLEAALDSRLVSHPKSPLSLDSISGDSLGIVVRPLDSVVPDYVVTLPDAADPQQLGLPRKKTNRYGAAKENQHAKNQLH